MWTDNYIDISSQARNSLVRSSEVGDKKLISHQMKTSLEIVGETDVAASSPLTAPSEPYSIKTAADFEAYALQNLQRNRLPPRPTHARLSNGHELSDIQPTPSSPFTDWHTPPKSRG
ncbi:hypothetical protein LTR36_002879 [Oleoguttula mirabilis]|uniref:Uncharacterized protein n=1 Tax=Oleoguttula mirabilis TaxID=1507867 RepID=A0AAV9JJV3_9PEZI|nr:hypothetical protein LTR36_002879 [Oleoguttula mirabilis]